MGVLLSNDTQDLIKSALGTPAAQQEVVNAIEGAVQSNNPTFNGTTTVNGILNLTSVNAPNDLAIFANSGGEITASGLNWAEDILAPDNSAVFIVQAGPATGPGNGHTMGVRGGAAAINGNGGNVDIAGAVGNGSGSAGIVQLFNAALSQGFQIDSNGNLIPVNSNAVTVGSLSNLVAAVYAAAFTALATGGFAPTAQYVSATSGGSTQMSGPSILQVHSSTTLSTYTITLPQNAVGGQIAILATDTTITTLTLNGGTGQAIVSPIATLTLAGARFVFNSANSEWMSF
jgi:hypothetical protein